MKSMAFHIILGLFFSATSLSACAQSGSKADGQEATTVDNQGEADQPAPPAPDPHPKEGETCSVPSGIGDGAPSTPETPDPLTPLALTPLESSVASTVWSPKRIAECKFDLRTSRILLRRLLAPTSTCDKLELAFTTAAGYWPKDTEDTDDDIKSLGLCLRPVLTSAFFNQLADLVKTCQTAEPVPKATPDPDSNAGTNPPCDKMEEEEKPLQKIQTVYDSCFQFADRMAVASSLTRVDFSALATDASPGQHSVRLNALRASDADLTSFLKSLQEPGIALDSAEAKAICSMAVNDVINAQNPRNFLAQ